MKEFKSWYEILLLLFTRRTVFTTQKGILGLAPDFSAEEDIVAILPGINTPVVFRPKNDEKASYMWVRGEAWLPDYMQGCVVDDLIKGLYVVRTFLLT